MNPAELPNYHVQEFNCCWNCEHNYYLDGEWCEKHATYVAPIGICESWEQEK